MLICDDYPMIRMLLREVVALRPGLTVVGEAGDGLEVVAEAARLQPDVILLDLAMPKQNGLDALREIARVAPDAKTVIFSGFSIDSLREATIAGGAVLYLQKGASPDAINDAIEAVHAMVAVP